MTMKIAFATEDLKHLDAHFGWAKHIKVYDVTPDDIHFVTTYDFAGNL
jgi:nitrogen fixation protein NifX